MEGELIGEGELKISKEEGSSHIACNLNFLCPWKWEARTAFGLRPAEQVVQVTWTLEGKLPWFAFFVEGITANMVDMNYNRGLAMLKEYVEKGFINASLDKPRLNSFETIHYVGQYIPACPVDSISESQPDFSKISDEIKKYGKHGKGLNVYHKMKMRNMTIDITAGYAVPAKVMENMRHALPSKYRYGTVTGGKGIEVEYRGGYTHIGNAWSAATSALSYAMRFKKHRPRCGIVGFETYKASPDDTKDEKDYRTSIWVPVK